ncbi:3-phosphoshikimate 1-carboxyvinyltransferase [candidate division KSB1 bacterium RBG_16_48_16]|nr:MAG: 3-phosphoshikimate 1-carboxyvinyltransferase [candidate division KSB1 bacterium RBG_16_48_16]
MADIVIKPVSSLQGHVVVPGDKSISHRALLLSAIAEGESTLTGLSAAEDVRHTRMCMEKMGIAFRDEAETVYVSGKGMYGLKKPDDVLYVGNSGTTIRLMTGILAAQPFESVIDGDESIRTRPMRRIIEPLEAMGAQIVSEDNKAPLRISGGVLRAINYASPIASAQIKSCIIMAGLYARGLTCVTEPSQSRDHTERMLKEFGAEAQYSRNGAGVKGPAHLTACHIDVPCDISAAAFFLIAACLLRDSTVRIKNVGINPTRTGVLDVLASMGAKIDMSDQSEISGEPRATLTARFSELGSVNLAGTIIPKIIDEIPIIAIAATQAGGVTTIRDAQELRVKESDRIAAMSINLRKMGGEVRETKDGLVISGPTGLKGAEIESYGDHRIAMSFAVAGLLAEGETIIKNYECVNTSFPGFFEKIDSLKND